MSVSWRAGKVPSLTIILKLCRALNIVPDIATFEFEFRTIAADKSSVLAKEVIDYAKNVLEPEMKRVAPEAGFVFEDRSEFAGLARRNTPNSRPWSHRGCGRRRFGIYRHMGSESTVRGRVVPVFSRYLLFTWLDQ